MATMPKKKSLTAKRVLSLFLAYVLLCLAGGVVTSAFFLPAVFAFQADAPGGGLA